MVTLFFLYGVIVLVLLIGAFFIVYHILHYSLTASLGYFGAVTFGTVFLFLLLINFFSFQAIESSSLIPALEIAPLLEIPQNAPTPAARNPW